MVVLVTNVKRNKKKKKRKWTRVKGKYNLIRGFIIAGVIRA